MKGEKMVTLPAHPHIYPHNVSPTRHWQPIRIMGPGIALFAVFTILAVPLRAREIPDEDARGQLTSPEDAPTPQSSPVTIHPPGNDTTDPVEESDDDGTQQPVEDQPDEKQLLENILTKLEAEPPLETLLHAALIQADADVEGARSWHRRVRLSPILPTVKLSVGYDLEHDENLDRTQTEPDQWGADSDQDLELEATLQWDFSKLVYHPEELKVQTALARRADRREALLTLLIGYWFERRQIQILLAVRPPKKLETGIQQTLRLKELTACIDALTGGRLTRK
jgi:hypothetical protein